MSSQAEEPEGLDLAQTTNDLENTEPATVTVEQSEEQNDDENITDSKENQVPKNTPQATGGPYSLAQLKAGEPWPSDVDPTKREMYLSDDEFQQVFSMSKAEFEKMPTWRRSERKRAIQLF